MQKGKVIFLNGTSSSGKTTLALALQERLTESFYLLSFDTFSMMTPQKGPLDEYMTARFKAISGMHHTIKTFSDLGLNTIIDHVLVEGQNTLEECVELLHERDVLFVHVVCPLEELRRREKEREHTDFRKIGSAESQLSIIVPQNTYDLTIDTYDNTVEECTNQIMEALNYPEKFTAFRTLWAQRT